MRIDPQATPQTSQRFIQIDEEGYFILDGLRVADAEFGQDLFRKMSMDETGCIRTQSDGHDVIVEAFDAPMIVQMVERDADGNFRLIFPYGHTEALALDSLSLDEWDRFHGRTGTGVPFVMSRKAQFAFFDLVDEFDDESVTINGQRHVLPSWLIDNPSVNSDEFWTEIYHTEGRPGWELEAPAPALVQLVPRLKLPTCRILVLGAGSANDAAYFAEQGHIVTAVDFSAEALTRAQSKYGHLRSLKFVQADVFKLPSSMDQSFDIVFEHTCYCAVNPSRRNELLRVWRRVLTPQGQLLGIFFAMDKRKGPPYGGSEWEVRERLKNSFRPLVWQRVRNSTPKRLGKEFIIFADRVSEF